MMLVKDWKLYYELYGACVECIFESQALIERANTGYIKIVKDCKVTEPNKFCTQRLKNKSRKITAAKRKKRET